MRKKLIWSFIVVTMAFGLIAIGALAASELQKIEAYLDNDISI